MTDWKFRTYPIVVGTVRLLFDATVLGRACAKFVVDKEGCGRRDGAARTSLRTESRTMKQTAF